MTADFAYDPVTAIDEAKAVGETAALFAEIRQTMCIPLVTSIWRGLAGMDDGLRLAWAAAKPIYESGEPEPALMRSVATVGLPRPESLAPTICLRGTDGKRHHRGARCRSKRPEPDGTGRLDRAVGNGRDHSAGRRCGGIPTKLVAAATSVAARGDRNGYLEHDPACKCVRFVWCRCGGRDALAASGALAGSSCADPRCVCAGGLKPRGAVAPPSPSCNLQPRHDRHQYPHRNRCNGSPRRPSKNSAGAENPATAVNTSG
jgi:hypothetical protein